MHVCFISLAFATVVEAAEIQITRARVASANDEDGIDSYHGDAVDYENDVDDDEDDDEDIDNGFNNF
jgi:hypothetical protein